MCRFCPRYVPLGPKVDDLGIRLGWAKVNSEQVSCLPVLVGIESFDGHETTSPRRKS